MPARKPKSLITRDETKADQAARDASESAMRPATDLNAHVPVELYGDEHAYAKRAWRYIMELYDVTEGELATAYDKPLLVIYCLALEEAHVELPKLKAAAWKTYRRLEEKLDDIEDEKEYINMAKQLVALLKEIKGIDARLDVKRSHIHKYQQSLYFTPRSRAGVAPPAKEPPEPEDEMAKLLKKGNGDG